jgi:hypothetical protein
MRVTHHSHRREPSNRREGPGMIWPLLFACKGYDTEFAWLVVLRGCDVTPSLFLRGEREQAPCCENVGKTTSTEAESV